MGVGWAEGPSLRGAGAAVGQQAQVGTWPAGKQDPPEVWSGGFSGDASRSCSLWLFSTLSFPRWLERWGCCP